MQCTIVIVVERSLLIFPRKSKTSKKIYYSSVANTLLLHRRVIHHLKENFSNKIQMSYVHVWMTFTGCQDDKKYLKITVYTRDN